MVSSVLYPDGSPDLSSLAPSHFLSIVIFMVLAHLPLAQSNIAGIFDVALFVSGWPIGTWKQPALACHAGFHCALKYIVSATTAFTACPCHHDDWISLLRSPIIPGHSTALLIYP
ncbi:MAG: hypothetical protein P8Z31_07600 [Gammaproteobacteria bacterium]